VSEKEEECFALINEYPDEGRGTRGRQYRSLKSLPDEKHTYEKYISMFEASWTKAKPLIWW